MRLTVWAGRDSGANGVDETHVCRSNGNRQSRARSAEFARKER